MQLPPGFQMPPGMPGMPAGGPFDFSAMQNLLNDPSIRTMAEQIAEDPAFAQLTKTLQQSLGGAAGGEGGDAAAAPAAAEGLNPEQYLNAMQGVMQNPSFMNMAEKLGQQLMQDPQMSSMLQGMSAPGYRDDLEGKLQVGVTRNQLYTTISSFTSSLSTVKLQLCTTITSEGLGRTLASV
jgi:hypothetical protein